MPDGKTYVIITVMRYANRGTDFSGNLFRMNHNVFEEYSFASDRWIDAGQFLYKLNTADEVLKKITGTSSNVLLA